MLKLIPPGFRKNKFWLIRGTLDGHKIDKSTGKSLRADAEKILNALIREYQAGTRINENVTFAQAAERYIDYRGPSRKDQISIGRLVDQMGPKLVSEITQNDLVQAANRLYPCGANETKNRRAITPAGAIIHYAARNKWCEWPRFTKFKEATAQTRFVTPEVEAKLLAATTGIRQLFLLWVFRQGDRHGDVLKVKYEDCNLTNRTIRRHIGKGDKYAEFPLDDDICQILQKDGQKTGFIFPWRSHVRWLKELTDKLGVEFTAHRARHTLGKRLNDSGAGLRTIMQTLGHSDYKSSLRYQTTDIETVRQAKEKANERCKPVPATDAGRAA